MSVIQLFAVFNDLFALIHAVDKLTSSVSTKEHKLIVTSVTIATCIATEAATIASLGPTQTSLSIVISLYADRVCGKRNETVPCLSVGQSVPGQRTRRQQQRAMNIVSRISLSHDSEILSTAAQPRNNKLYKKATTSRSNGIRANEQPRRVDRRRCDQQARPSKSFVDNKI